MTASNTIPTMLLILFLAIAIPSGLYLRKVPAPAITPAEAEVAKFTSQAVDMSLPQPPVVFSGLVSPVTAPHVKPETVPGEKPTGPAVALPAATKTVEPVPPLSLGSLPVVSMISYDGATRTAIVGNRVVTEGSELGGGKIVKIEENRVLMRKAGKNIWLTIE